MPPHSSARPIATGKRRSIYDNNEATILSDVLTRALRDQFMTEDRLSKLRSGLQAKGPYQTRPMIWFTAVAQAAGKRGILVQNEGRIDPGVKNCRRVLAALRTKPSTPRDRPNQEAYRAMTPPRCSSCSPIRAS